MNKTIGILAHVDAGKTTFAEQILYYTKSIKNRGRVDHKNSFLDSHSIEKDRGITVFSDQGVFSYNDSNYYLIDTPGHVDFSPEMERSIGVMDYAIVIISGVEGIQGHTETVWQLLRKHNVPTFFFINKIDRDLANAENVLEEIRSTLSKDVCFITESFQNGEMSSELIEFIAERDELLFEKYLEQGYEKYLWLNSMKRMVKDNRIFPCLSGSALQDIGIDSFLEKLDMLTYTEYSDEGEFSGKVYKIRYDEQGNRVTYIKALSGGDFREATLRALRHGLEKAKNVLLEPYYRYKIEVELDYMGRILSDIQKLNGFFEPPQMYYNKATIIGRGPVATFMNYGIEFISITKGKGKINFIVDGYDICHNEEEVIKKIGYDKNADIEYTATSIFCSKGQAFLVMGDGAEGYMHCLK